MFRLAIDTLNFVNSFPAVIPDFDSRHSGKVIINDSNDHTSMLNGNQSAGQLIVLMHCHYPSLLGYFTPYLNRILDYDIIITITSPQHEKTVWEWASTLKPNVNKPRCLSIKYFSNNGRDVRPFWETGIEISDKYTVFLKLHTKSSPQFKDFTGLTWLKDILENLLGDSSTIQNITSKIHYNKYGAVFPVPWRPFRDWGWANKDNLYHSEEICKALSIHPSILLHPLQYPVGNMYWGSPSIFRTYGDKILSSLAWPEEPLPTNGTLLHSLERITGYLYKAQKQKIAYSSCTKSTAMEQGLFTWDVRDLNDELNESLLLARDVVRVSILLGNFSTASSLEYILNGITSCIPVEGSNLFNLVLSKYIHIILLFQQYFKRTTLEKYINLSPPIFFLYISIAFHTSRVNPFLNQKSTTMIKYKSTILCRKIYSIFFSIKRICTGIHR